MWKYSGTKVRKIGILRALQLGDMLCSVPAIRALKEGAPEASVHLIGLPWARQFTERFSQYFDGFIEFPGYPGLPEQPYDSGKFLDFLERMNKEKFDLIIQMHGNGTIINRFLPMLGSSDYAGYYCEKAYNPVPGNFMLYPEEGNEVSRHMKLINFMGIRSSDLRLEWTVAGNEIREFARLKTQYRLSTGKYVVIHPGARDLKKWWPAENFALAGDRFTKLGYKVVVTGTSEEQEVTRSVISSMKHPCIDLSGKTSLGIIALLIKEAAMLFSNDTGVSHIAAAVQTPSIVIFLASDPERWAPLNQKMHQVILPEKSLDTEYVLVKAEETLLKQIA
jgi:ADP-heptose:LPS heptosyltransferase